MVNQNIDGKGMRRPWFQFHLSTCIVMMVVAGLFLWLNTQSQSWEVSENRLRWPKEWMIDRTYGWPYIFYYDGYTVLGAPHFYAKELVADLLIVAISVCAVGAATETFLRRRSSRDKRNSETQ